MDIITALRGIFTRHAHHEKESFRTFDRSHDLGIQAAQLYTYMNLSVPTSVYEYRIEQADKVLSELMTQGSFNLARFEAGYKSIVDQPYDRERDILKLRRKLPRVFEAGMQEEVAEPIAF